ncbi:toxin-antitoxin system YwqK family antitoxin [Marinifilum caeruleilacunae]|uniref:Toxin-antitoxin system YwqK family antitoxin n=1 Tax=Marinifilum caeruleilacunae TaxID=2499076 RepID=A0ABX1WT14_9BACT|nr:hypothetical protein [Marinifilum caeruleilacunae]NOU59248.1 hypothetical protein [Marinifilum caeruleilacunae]
MRKIILLSLIALLFSSCDLIVAGIESVKTISRESKKQKEAKKEEVILKPTAKNGVKKYYYKNGKIKSVVTYKDNKKVGVSNTYYKTGEKQYDIPYQDGKKHGKVIWYYRSGKVYRETDYEFGKKNGYQRKYWESGKLKSETLYKDNMLATGLKEISNTNKVKSVPKIVVQKIDRTAANNEYILRFSLSNKKTKVSYYLSKLIEGKYFPADGRGFMEIVGQKGVAEHKIKIDKGTQLIHDFHIVAIESTAYKNKRVLSTVVPVSIRNPF